MRFMNIGERTSAGWVFNQKIFEGFDPSLECNKQHATPSGVPPLIWHCAYQGRTDKVQALIEGGCNVNVRNLYGNVKLNIYGANSLYSCFLFGTPRKRCIHLLLDAGIDISGFEARGIVQERIAFHNSSLKQIENSLLKHKLEFPEALIEEICGFVYLRRGGKKRKNEEGHCKTKKRKVD